jgi:hypothetical protein
MADSKVAGYPVLQFLDILAVIGEPTAIKNIFDAIEKALPVTDVGTANNEGGGVVRVST